jgi:hypothetical protein
MNRAELARHPLTVLRLAGSQAEMGTQQGRLLRAIGGYEGAADFYPVMASRMLTQSLPYGVRPAARELARRLLNQAARRMHQNRRSRPTRRAPRHCCRQVVSRWSSRRRCW